MLATGIASIDLSFTGSQEIIAHCLDVAARSGGGLGEIKPVAMLPAVKVYHTIVPD